MSYKDTMRDICYQVLCKIVATLTFITILVLLLYLSTELLRFLENLTKYPDIGWIEAWDIPKNKDEDPSYDFMAIYWFLMTLPFTTYASYYMARIVENYSLSKIKSIIGEVKIQKPFGFFIFLLIAFISWIVMSVFVFVSKIAGVLTSSIDMLVFTIIIWLGGFVVIESIICKIKNKK